MVCLFCLFCVFGWDENSLVYYNRLALYRIKDKCSRVHQKLPLELTLLLKPRKELLTSSSQDNDQIKSPTNGFQSATSSLWISDWSRRRKSPWLKFSKENSEGWAGVGGCIQNVTSSGDHRMLQSARIEPSLGRNSLSRLRALLSLLSSLTRPLKRQKIINVRLTRVYIVINLVAGNNWIPLDH